MKLKNTAFVDNIIRLVDKARTMPVEAAAQYLVPLSQLQTGPTAEEQIATASIVLLIGSLRSGAAMEDHWKATFAALESWRNSLDATSLQ